MFGHKTALMAMRSSWLELMVIGIVTLNIAFNLAALLAFTWMIGVSNPDFPWEWDVFNGKVPDFTGVGEVVSLYPVSVQFRVEDDRCDASTPSFLRILFSCMVASLAAVPLVGIWTSPPVTARRWKWPVLLPVVLMFAYLYQMWYNTHKSVDCWEQPAFPFNCTRDFKLVATSSFKTSFEQRQFSLPEAWNLLTTNDVASVKCSRLPVVPSTSFENLLQAGVQQWVPVTMPCNKMDIRASHVHVLQQMGPQCTVCVGVSVSCGQAVVQHEAAMLEAGAKLPNLRLTEAIMKIWMFVHPTLFVLEIGTVLLLDALLVKLLLATNDDIERRCLYRFALRTVRWWFQTTTNENCHQV